MAFPVPVPVPVPIPDLDLPARMRQFRRPKLCCGPLSNHISQEVLTDNLLNLLKLTELPPIT